MLCFQDSGCFPLQGETEAEEEVNHCEFDDHGDDHGDVHGDDHGDDNGDDHDDDYIDDHIDDNDDPLMQRFSLKLKSKHYNF